MQPRTSAHSSRYLIMYIYLGETAFKAVGTYCMCPLKLNDSLMPTPGKVSDIKAASQGVSEEVTAAVEEHLFYMLRSLMWGLL